MQFISIFAIVDLLNLQRQNEILVIVIGIRQQTESKKLYVYHSFNAIK